MFEINCAALRVIVHNPSECRIYINSFIARLHCIAIQLIERIKKMFEKLIKNIWNVFHPPFSFKTFQYLW